MRNTGIVRKTDSIGRLCIPIEVRRLYGINILDEVEIYREQEAIILQKFDRSKHEYEHDLGIVRKVDKLGRIDMPAEVRRELGIFPGNELEIHTDSGKIILSKHNELCHCCGAEDKLIQIYDVHMCKKCIGMYYRAMITMEDSNNG